MKWSGPTRETFTQFLDAGGLLLLTNLLIFLLVISGLQALPGQSSSKEIPIDHSEPAILD